MIMQAKKCNSLAEIREQIDLLDGEIIKLLNLRYTYVKAASCFKRDEDAVRAPDRVQQVIDKVRLLASEVSLPPSLAEAVYRVLISQFVALELNEHKTQADPKKV